jgi:hypothetical protein
MENIVKKNIAFLVFFVFCSTTVFATPLASVISQIPDNTLQNIPCTEGDLFSKVNATELTTEEANEE